MRDVAAFIAEMRADPRVDHIADRFAAELQELDCLGDGHAPSIHFLDDLRRIMRSERPLSVRISDIAVRIELEVIMGTTGGW